MKKFLLILFIAILLNDFILGAGLIDEWEKLKNNATTAREWLERHNLWTPIVNALNTIGKKGALQKCKSLTIEEICESIVDFIYSLHY